MRSLTLVDPAVFHTPLKFLAQVPRVPVHLIWGERDNVFPLREAYRLTAMLTGVTEAPVVTVLPDAGHFPHESHPEAFNRALLRFLQP